jgi:hypothetical protein
MAKKIMDECTNICMYHTHRGEIGGVHNATGLRVKAGGEMGHVPNDN